MLFQQERQSVEDLQRALSSAKELYRTTLANLERISNEIHAQRNADRAAELPPRTPGVGAEAECCDQLDKLSINLGESRAEIGLTSCQSISVSHGLRSA